MSGWQKREDTGVHNTEVARAVHLQVSVHHTALRLGSHLATSRRVVQCSEIRADKSLQISIADNTRTGENLSWLQGLDRLGVSQRPGELDGLDEDLEVDGVREVTRRSDGRVKDAAGGGADTSTGKGVLQAADDDAGGPNVLHGGGIGAAQTIGEDAELLLVAGHDLVGRVGWEVLCGSLGGSGGDDGG